MLSLGKTFLLIAAALAIVIWVPLGALAHDIQGQATILSVALLSNIAFKRKRFAPFFRYVLLFLILFSITITAFIYFGWSDQSSYWKLFYFSSSILGVRVCIGLISFHDLMKLPISSELRRDLTLMRSLLEHGGPGVERLGWYCARLTGGRLSFRSGLATVLGAFIWLQEEAVHFAAVIDNRRRWLLGEAND